MPAPTLTLSPLPSLTPTPLPSGIVSRLCPELGGPLGLFYDPEPFYDQSTDPATLYARYQLVELSKFPSRDLCDLYLSPPPIGDPQIAGDSLFWKSYDDENEWIIVWKYDPDYQPGDDGYPQHLFLRQTRTNTSIGKSGLFDFVVSVDGQTVVWAYTEPETYEGYETSYLREMYAAATSGPIDQRPPVELWNDFIWEPETESNIVRPLSISSDGEMVYYSLEPVGLGGQWPEPLGRSTSLYSISTWWYGTPTPHFDCGNDYWCISDFSDELDLLVSVQEGTIQIFELSSGNLLAQVPAPEDYPTVRQAMISSDGVIVFLGVVEGGFGDPPENVGIFTLQPPYQGEPLLVLHDPGLLNLLAWSSPTVLLADGNDLEESDSRGGTLPSDLMLVDLESRQGEWLGLDARWFVSLVR